MPTILINQPVEQVEEKGETPTISEIIEVGSCNTGSSEEMLHTTLSSLQTIAVEEVGPSQELSLPLPMDHVFYKWTTAERRAMYDYVVQVHIHVCRDSN